MPKPVPDGFRTVTPYLHIRNAREAIAFYMKAFGAEEVMSLAGPDGKIAHAEIRIGDSIIMLGEECTQQQALSPLSVNGTTVGIHLYVADVEAAFERAVRAGATVRSPLADMFWGDRMGSLVDPFGHAWSLAQHVEDVPPDEMEQRAAAAMKQMAC